MEIVTKDINSSEKPTELSDRNNLGYSSISRTQHDIWEQLELAYKTPPQNLLSLESKVQLIKVLKNRFAENIKFHKGI